MSDKDPKDLEEKKSEEEFDEKQLKELEEQLYKMIESSEEFKQKRFKALLFSYATHKYFLVHLLIILLINTLSVSAIIGISGYAKVTNIYLYFSGLVLFTFTEVFLRLIFIKYLQKTVIKSYGLIHLIYTVPLFFLTIELLGGLFFEDITSRIIIVSFFLILRFFVSYYIKMLTFNRRTRS